MKASIRVSTVLVFGILSCSAHGAEKENPGFATALSKTYNTIIDKGAAFWGKLGESQARTVLDRAGSEAGRLVAEKADVRNRLEQNLLTRDEFF